MELNSTECDTILVKRLKLGQTDAFDQLYEKYSLKLYSFSRSLLKTHEDAEGVVQEVFLRVWSKRTGLLEQKSFKAFLFRIAYNVIIDQFRQQSKDQKYEQHVIHQAQRNYFNLADKLEFEQLESQVERAVNELPEKRKQIFQLSRVEGLNYKEIAIRKKIATKTVENHINLALKHIRKQLKESSNYF